MVVFVEGGDTLGGYLAAEPVGFLQEADLASSARRRPRRSDAAKASAYNKNVTLDVSHRRFVVDRHYRTQGITRRRNSHYVQQSLSLICMPMGLVHDDEFA